MLDNLEIVRQVSNNDENSFIMGEKGVYYCVVMNIDKDGKSQMIDVEMNKNG
jgi:hypothetical protein